MFNAKIKDLSATSPDEVLQAGAKTLAKLGVKHRSPETAAPFFLWLDYPYPEGEPDLLFVSGKLSPHKAFIAKNKNEKGTMSGYAYLEFDAKGQPAALCLLPVRQKAKPKLVEKTLYLAIKKRFEVRVLAEVAENPALDAAAEAAEDDAEDKTAPDPQAELLRKAKKITAIFKRIQPDPQSEANQPERALLLRQLPKWIAQAKALPQLSGEVQAFLPQAQQLLRRLQPETPTAQETPASPKLAQAQTLLREIAQLMRQIAQAKAELKARKA